MKKVFVATFLISLSVLLFAQEEDEGKGKWKASAGIVTPISPVSKQVPVTSEDEVHFAPITGFGGFVPVLQGSISYSLPVHLSDNLLFSGSNVSFSVAPMVTPVSLSNQFSVSFAPTPVLSFRAGCNLGTCWPIFDMNSGVYDKESNSYTKLNPFAAWQMSLSAGVNFQFDLGIFHPGKWNHIITTAGYTINYTRLLNANDGELWEYMGSKENLNVMKYSVSAMIGYLLPLNNSVIGVSSNWSGYLDSQAYKKYGYDYNCDFVDCSLSLMGTFPLNKKNTLVTTLSFPSRRAYYEEIKQDESLFGKHVAGREWYFGGLMVAWQISLL